MKNFNVAFLVSALAALTSVGCQDQFYSRDPSVQIMENNATAEFEPSTSYVNPGGNPVPYPEIIRQTFIPRDDLYDWKCTAWRITWPEYPEGFDVDKIPTTFSLNGALNSFYYLNNVGSQTTYNTLFSLYYEDKIQRTVDMPDELNFFVNPPLKSFSYAELRLDDVGLTANDIQYMVEQSPASFQANWSSSPDIEELEYAAGDIVFFYTHTPDAPSHFGGIRIVSMNPRIIEVYITSPQ